MQRFINDARKQRTAQVERTYFVSCPARVPAQMPISKASLFQRVARGLPDWGICSRYAASGCKRHNRIKGGRAPGHEFLQGLELNWLKQVIKIEMLWAGLPCPHVPSRRTTAGPASFSAPAFRRPAVRRVSSQPKQHTCDDMTHRDPRQAGPASIVRMPSGVASWIRIGQRAPGPGRGAEFLPQNPAFSQLRVRG